MVVDRTAIGRACRTETAFATSPRIDSDEVQEMHENLCGNPKTFAIPSSLGAQSDPPNACAKFSFPQLLLLI